MKDTLVVMGSHPRTRGEFDWNRTDCDVVVFNEAMKQEWVKRADYVMQMHLPVIWRNPGNRNDPNHYAWLKSGNTPIIWMQEEFEDVPKSKRYPIEEVIRLGRRYITSSAAYSIAVGIQMGYKRIEIYGVEMETNTEYQHQRPGVAYWIGFAEGKGITVDFHGELMTSPLYGYDGDVRLPYSYFDERIAELKLTAEKAQKEYNDYREVVKLATEKFIEDGQDPDALVKMFMRQIELAALFGLQNGAVQEVARYKKKADDQIQATGEHLFSRQEYEHAAASFTKERDTASYNAKAFGDECRRRFEYIKSTSNKGKRKHRLSLFIEMLTKYVQEASKVGTFDGASKENLLFMKRMDELVRMAGGDKSAEVMMDQYAKEIG